MAATELGTAYVSIVAETSKLEQGIKSALQGGGKQADLIGSDIGKKISASASKAMRSGWRPEQDIMAGIPDTKLDRIGARIGQVIGKGVVGGLKARKVGVDFGNAFAQGAGSVGLGRVIAGWRSELSGGALNSIGMLAGKSLSMGLTAAAGVAVGGIGLALTKGFDRLSKIDAAKAKLRAMKMSTQEVADTVKLVTDSVTGTPFSLDAAFGTATMAIGAGVKDIKRFMQDVTDAAGFAGVDLDRMGTIFTQIQAKGKLTGEEMMQLMEAGLPARSWIEKSYNLTAEQFDKMQQKGQITMEMLQTSIEQNAGGMAANAGKTLQGAIDNMQTAIARIGANFLSAIFGGEGGDDTEKMRNAIDRITAKLNELNNWINTHREEIRQFFTDAADAAKKVVDVVGDVLTTIQKLPGGIDAVVVAFAAWEGIKFAGLLGQLGLVSGALGGIAGAVAAISGGLAYILKDNPVLGNKGTVGNGGGILPPLSGGWGDGTGVVPPLSGALNGSPSSIFGGPGAQRERRGLPPLDPTGGLLGGTVTPSGGGTGRFPSAMPPKMAGAEGWRPAVQQAIAQYGPSLGITNTKAWEDALVRQIQTESGGNPFADNPNDSNGRGGKQHVTGLLQFLPTTFAAHNISGGAYKDPNAQIAAALHYVTNRYGMDKNGAPLQIGRGVGYAAGGSVRGAGSGKSDSIPAMLSHGEHVLTASDVNAMGGQSGVYSFRSRLHRSGGGPAEPLEDEPGWNPDTMGNRRRGPLEDEPGWNPDTMGNLRRGPLEDEPGWDWQTMGNGRRGYDYVLMGGNHIRGYAEGGAVLAKLEDMRTKGAIPAAAGSTAKAGESSIAKGIAMGGEFINGLIDQAASAASTAAAAAAAAGTMGAGAGPGGSQAAAMATQFLISAGTNAAKRSVQYGFQLGGIGVDSVLQQLTPFGMPRWLTQDYSGFMPQWDSQGALGDLMSAGAQNAVDPNTTQHGTGQGAAPGPSPSAMGPAELAPPDLFQNNANDFLSTELQQVEAPAPDAQPVYKIDNVYTQDVDQFGRELAKQGRLASMQYTGRPGP